jgi:hypothetical protein
MKGIAKPTIYFSAYPLKAVEQATSSRKESAPTSPYLRSLLSGKSKNTDRSRIFPMINPYKNPYPEVAKEVTKLSAIDRVMMKHTPEEKEQRS